MIFSSKTLAILTFASALGFGAMVVLSEIYLSAWDSLLDGRLIGYDVGAVTKYLELLSNEARAFSIGPFLSLGTIVPPLLALTFIALIWSLGQKFWRVTVIFSMICVFADLRENAFVGQILLAGFENLNGDMISITSDMTQLKWLFTVLSLAVVLWLWRKGWAQL